MKLVDSIPISLPEAPDTAKFMSHDTMLINTSNHFYFVRKAERYQTKKKTTFFRQLEDKVVEYDDKDAALVIIDVKNGR